MANSNVPVLSLNNDLEDFPNNLEVPTWNTTLKKFLMQAQSGGGGLPSGTDGQILWIDPASHLPAFNNIISSAKPYTFQSVGANLSLLSDTFISINNSNNKIEILPLELKISNWASTGLIDMQTNLLLIQTFGVTLYLTSDHLTFLECGDAHLQLNTGVASLHTSNNSLTMNSGGACVLDCVGFETGLTSDTAIHLLMPISTHGCQIIMTNTLIELRNDSNININGVNQIPGIGATAAGIASGNAVELITADGTIRRVLLAV